MQETTAIAAGERRLTALPQRLRSALEFRYVALLTVIATYGLIVLGGTVRSTNSGTACPDWPLCKGRVVPPLEGKVIIEYSHRVVASVVGFLIIGLVTWAWLKQRENKLIARAAVAAVVLLAAQIIAGGVTVDTETAPAVVAAHLTIALTLLTTLIVLAVAAFLPQQAMAGGRSLLKLRPLAAATLAATLALIILGTFVSKEGAGLAYPDWPLFDGSLWTAGGKLANLHYAHRLMAVLVGVFLLALVMRTLRREQSPVVLGGMAAAFALYVAQVLAGAANIWSELATPVRILHLALGSALWAVLAFTIVWGHLQAEGAAGDTR